MGGFDSEMMDYFATAGRMQGADESFLRIFAALYMEPEEITLEELAEKTGYSLASVSNKLRALEGSGSITRTCKPGSKRIYVYMEKDFLEIMKKQLIAKHEKIIKLAKARIPEILAKHEGRLKSENERKKARIVKDYLAQVEKAETLLPKMVALISESQQK